jgi:DNA-binding HxlR family transcriptional regulator
VRYAYRLTPMGTAVHPILKEIALWGARFLPYANMPPEELLRRARN